MTLLSLRLPAVPGGRRFGVVGGCAGRRRHDKTSVHDGSVGRMHGTRTCELDHYADRAPLSTRQRSNSTILQCSWKRVRVRLSDDDAGLVPRPCHGTDR